MKILLGSDPELFVKQGGEFISAHGMVDGTKEHPHPVRHGAVQVDGMALEYNTDPVSTVEEWERNHRSVQRRLRRMIGKDLELSATPTAFFTDEVFNSTPDDAKILGCEADFNAWTQGVNPTPNAKVPFRTGAGHIHIGWTTGADILDEFHLGECYALVKVLDLFLGVPSIIMDGDVKRRDLYGKAGAFRPKSYGLEYRVLSNFWTKTPALRAWAFNNTLKGIEYAQNQGVNSYTQDIINCSNRFDAIDSCINNGVDYERPI